MALLLSKLKGKAPKDVSEALKDIKDYVAFHQNVSVAMGTALKHLADSLFVKPDTWNLLRNAPMFGHGLFPDSVLATAEQDITKLESAGVAPGPGPGASQRSSGRGSARYRPYEKRESQQGAGQVPTRDSWTSLLQKLNFIKARNYCTVRQFMSLIGLLTATEKQVWSDRLHMRPFTGI